LWFDTEVVDLVAEMFDGDPDFLGLGTLPRLKPLHRGDVDDGAQDQDGGDSEEEEPIRYYHEIKCKSRLP
jgi:hypothetical protein